MGLPWAHSRAAGEMPAVVMQEGVGGPFMDHGAEQLAHDLGADRLVVPLALGDGFPAIGAADVQIDAAVTAAATNL